MYAKKNMDGYFFTTKGFYVMNIPVAVPYKKIYALADAAGLKKAQPAGPILEKGSFFGWGWIGIEVEKPAQAREDVVHVKGAYESFLFRGPYKSLRKACQQLQKDRPHSQRLYNLYLDDPAKTKPEDLRTELIFK